MAKFINTNRLIKNLKELNYTKLFLELAVVFLGVTAGFLLQNQKEQNQSEELELKYLAGFYSDVSLNISELDSLIYTDSIWISNNYYALHQIEVDSFSIDSANSLIKQMLAYGEFTKQTSTYENIINSSDLNIIQDYDLKLQIVDYHKSLTDFKLLEHYIKDFHTTHFVPYVMTHFDMFSQSLIDPESRKSVIYKNQTGISYSLIHQRWQAYKQLLIESDSLQTALTPYQPNLSVK